MMQETKWRLRQYGLRWLFWVIVLMPFLFAQFSRKNLDMLHIWAGSGEITVYVMPSTIGVEYFPEVYRKTLTQIRTMKYTGIPFNGPHFDDKIRKDKYLIPSLKGFFFYYYFSNGGPHWTISGAVPCWFIGALITTLLVFIPNFPRWKFLALTRIGRSGSDRSEDTAEVAEGVSRDDH